MTKQDNTAMEEAEYKNNWINQHDKADKLEYDTVTKLPVSATYFYPPYHHIKEIDAIFTEIKSGLL